VTGSEPNETPNTEPARPQTPQEAERAFRLRAERSPVTRLSRKVLAGGTALALLLIGGAVLWALQNNRPRNPAPDELYSTDHHNVADGLTELPRDYADIPHDVPRL
jgi:type IV secretion system protein VirB10